VTPSELIWISDDCPNVGAILSLNSSAARGVLATGPAVYVTVTFGSQSRMVCLKNASFSSRSVHDALDDAHLEKLLIPMKYGGRGRARALHASVPHPLAQALPTPLHKTYPLEFASDEIAKRLAGGQP